MHVWSKQLCALDSLNQCRSSSWPKYTQLIGKALRLKTPDGPRLFLVHDWQIKTVKFLKIEYASGIFCHSSIFKICLLLVTTFFSPQWPLTPLSSFTYSHTEACTPRLVMQRSSCNTPFNHHTPSTSPALFSQSAWTHAGCWSGPNLGWIWAKHMPILCSKPAKSEP